MAVSILLLFLAFGAAYALPQISVPTPVVTTSATITAAPLVERAQLANFIGWSSYTTSDNATSYRSQYCSDSLSYAESVHSGTTYGQCCDVGNSNCATSIFALSCVDNIEWAGTVSLRDCGSWTCNNALIYQTFGDTNPPVHWHGCQRNAQGGTYYRTMPPNGAVWQSASASASPSSPSSSTNEHRLRAPAIAGIVVGATIIFIVLFVWLPLYYLSHRTKSQNNPVSYQQPSQGTAAASLSPPAPTVVKHFWFAPFSRFTTSEKKPDTSDAHQPVDDQPPRYEQVPSQTAGIPK